MWALVFETEMLLIVAQAVLGGVGFLVQGYPWFGLIITLLFFWFLIRTAGVLRKEIATRRTRGKRISRARLVFATVVIWQLPAVIGLLVPTWARFWQGALLPVATTLDLWWPHPVTSSWLGACALFEMLLFAAVAGKSVGAQAREKAGAPAPAAAAATSSAGNQRREWAPARRHKDVIREKEQAD